MNELKAYIDNPNNDIVNFNLGLFYESQKHYSPASTFYLRAAEKTNSLDLRYEVLIRNFICYNALGNRGQTCESILKQAISLCPKKPEAYFYITKLYENKNDWLNVYTYANIALDVCVDKSNFLSTIDYPGTYSLIFQKAASAWHIGKPSESRKLFRLLLEKYLDQIDTNYRSILESNLSRLGCGPESNANRRYNKSLLSRFKYPFKDIESINENFSQVYQDMFVLCALNGKKSGTYLEIGSSDPYKNNNTALLESIFGWSGVGIEYNEDLVKQYRSKRKNPIVCTDALIVDYNKLITKYIPNTLYIDYLQLDIDPPVNTYEVLLSIPFDKFKFGIITYEHDYYIDITRSYKQKSRDYLQSLGYVLAVSNVSPDEYSPFEDWWINPEVILNIEFAAKIDQIHQIERYFLI